MHDAASATTAIIPMTMPTFAPADKPLGEEELPIPGIEVELGEPVGLEVLEAAGEPEEPGDAVFVGLDVEDVDVNNSPSLLEVMKARI